MPKRQQLTPKQARARVREARKARPSVLSQKLARNLTELFQITPGQRIGVAVSGGADSVALLRLLLEAHKQLGIVLSVAHFNHQLRGKASDADEKFVAKLAAQYGLAFLVGREDVAAKAKQSRANLEETARRCRYAFFEQLAAEDKLDRIAVAHTADDQAETVLSHMLRGTGIAGLGGIHPEAGVVFRPLLQFRRDELREYLRSFRQTWREDATNRDTKRTRARIRRKLIPSLEKEFQPAVVEHLCQLAEFARGDERWMESAAEAKVCAAAKEDRGSWRIAVRELIQEKQRPASLLGSGQAEGGPYNSSAMAPTSHILANAGRAGLRSGQCTSNEALSNRMVRVLVKRVKPRAGQLSAVHVGTVLRLARDPDSGKSVHLPGGVEVRRERDSLCFRPVKNGPRDVDARGTRFEYSVDLRAGDADLYLVEHSCLLRFQTIDWLRQGRETRTTGAVLDRDKLGVSLVVRNWRPGDRMHPLGHRKSHGLSRLLNELGVSRWEKAGWPVLVCGGSIAWARGLAAAVEFAAGESTQKGVMITEVPLTQAWQT